MTAASRLEIVRKSTGLGSAGLHAAVDIQDVASNKARIVRRKVHDGSGDLGGSADSLLGVQGREIVLHVFTSGEAVEHRGLDRSRGDRIDTDAGIAELQCDRLGQAFYRMLAGGINRRASSALVAVG